MVPFPDAEAISSKAKPLDLQIKPRMLQLPFEGNGAHAFNGVYIPAQVFRKPGQRLFGLPGVAVAQRLDGAQDSLRVRGRKRLTVK